MHSGLNVRYYDVFIDLDFDGLKYEGYEKIGLSTHGELAIDSVGV